MINDQETKKEIKNAYQGLLLTEPIFIHPSSVLFKELPEFICYTEMVETSKMYMKNVNYVYSSWFAVYCANQCTFAKPIMRIKSHALIQTKVLWYVIVKLRLVVLCGRLNQLK